ncbi:MAG TPA: 16S rRNA (uracil(1498)-N(3))-methyltransferase [Steroidobacteraceae bacterium]|jgi:16S rRNA (uracil1498-N3)-methyltransferase|nr:16S rRNA (uracil(1498)-N(3))-methyltransferase [Steroidobacteraceae bacterium]
MRLTRLHVEGPLASGRRITLAGNAASHVTRVLRLRVGAQLVLFDGSGGEYEGSIDKAHGGEVTVAIGEHHALERESPLALTLAQGVSRGERMDLVVQKATELGVTRIVPVLTERSVVRLTAQQSDRKVNHWRAITIAACEQCGRNRLPELAAPVTLAQLLGGDGGSGMASGMRLLLSPEGSATLAGLMRPTAAATVLIGPEGGFSDAEEQAAVAAGFTAVRLGPRVLRTETAAIAALTLLQRELGDL